MNFVPTILHEEQRFFTLLFIYYSKKIEDKNVDREILLKNVPNATVDPTQVMTEEYMDRILGKLMKSGYIRLESDGEKSYYEVTDAGIDFMKKNHVFVPSGREQILPKYLPDEELKDLLNALADAHDVQIGIMDEDRRFLRRSSEPARGICDICVRRRSSVNCACSDLLAARRARKIGTHTFKCHAGFVECIAPIGLDGEQCGFVFLGRIIPDDIDVDRFIQYCRDRDEPDIGEEKFRSLLETQRTPEEIEFIEEITAGIAILLSTLVRELSNYNTNIEMLGNMTAAGVGARGFDDVFQEIMKSAKMAFEYDGSAIWLLDIDQQKLRPAVSENALPQFDKDACFDIKEDGFISWIAEEKEPLLIGDVPNHVRRDDVPAAKYKDYIEHKKLTSFLGVPLKVQNRLIGVFEIEKHGKGQFTELDQELLTAIGRVSGIVLKESMLLDVLTHMSEKHNMEELLETAVTEMPALVGTEYCSIFLLDPERKKLVLRATNSRYLRVETNRAYYDDERNGLTWHLAKTGKTIMTMNEHNEPSWKGQYWESGHDGAFGFLGCVLKDNAGEVRGVIRFVGIGQLPFGERDKKVAEILATWLSLAIDRIRLAIIVGEHSGLLLRIGEIQDSASDINDLLNKTASEIARTLRCKSCEIALVHKEQDNLVVIGAYGAEQEADHYTAGDDSLIGRVAQKHDVISITDDAASPYWPQSVAKLGIPLMYGEELIGVLGLERIIYGGAREFTRDDETSGRIIAAEIARTIHEYQQRGNVAALLREVDKLYTKDRDAISVLKYMIENTTKVIAGSRGTLYRHDTSDNTFVRVASSVVEGGLPEKTKAGHLVVIFETKKELYIPDSLKTKEHQDLLKSDEVSEQAKEFIRSIGSEYALPLIVAGRMYGILCFTKPEIDDFSITDRQAADDIAARASLLLESHELLVAQRKLYHASSRLQTTLRLDELQKEVVQSIVEIGYDRARLYLISSDGKRIESVAQVGLEDPDNIRRFVNRGIVGELNKELPDLKVGIPKEIEDTDVTTYTLELGCPVIHVRKGSSSEKTIKQRDTEGIYIIATETPGYESELEREDVDEWLDFPLITARENLGKIAVDNKRSKRPFSRIDCEVLGLFGRYAAQAIMNALEIERTAGFGYGARSLAHNIKNRSASIGIVLDLIQRQPLPEKLARRIATLERANDAILRHVDAMRKAVDLEETELKTITVSELARAISNELKDILDKEEVSFEIDIPRAVLKEKAEVDMDQIIEVFLNLMRNSLEAAIDGIKPEVVLSAWLESDHIHISWQDNGPGISEKNSENLFTMGFTTKLGGTGTGLYTARRMLLKNRGDIRLDKSQKNAKGNYVACFVMKIPLQRDRADPRDADSLDERRARS